MGKTQKQMEEVLVKLKNFEYSKDNPAPTEVVREVIRQVTGNYDSIHVSRFFNSMKDAKMIEYTEEENQVRLL